MAARRTGAEPMRRTAGGLAAPETVGLRAERRAELRQLEWSQRLHLHRRNVLGGDESTVGISLWARAVHGGAQALAQKTGAIAKGYRADLVVLNADPLADIKSTRAIDAVYIAGNPIAR